MNKKQFAMLCMNYGKEPNEELFNIWNEDLKQYDEKDIEKALNNIIKKEKYMPNLAKIKNELKNVIKQNNGGIDWLDNEIQAEELDEETQKIFDDFNKFIEEFRKS